MIANTPASPFTSCWMTQIIHHEIALHPCGIAQDWYKLFYQAVFGPGHAIASLQDATDFLLRELQEAEQFAPWDVQPLGHYVRVNLRVCKECKLSSEQLIEAFIGSVHPSPLDAEQWCALWRQIVERILQMHPDANKLDFSQTHLWAAQKRMCSHSDKFRRLYHPHYRVVNRDKMAHLM